MSTTDMEMRELALAEAAHELRAPLGGIESMIQLLATTGLSPEQRRIMTALQAATAHLRTVSSDIIDQARGKVRSAPGAAMADFNLRDLLDSIAASAEARASAKGLGFRLDLDAELPTEVMGDARSIRQMLENLLDNAVKVTTDGAVSLTVRNVDRRGAFVGLVFSVEDTGPGISEQDKDKLFKSFSRINNGVPGSGLGLAVVARMARAMGGDAGCSSEEGQGATFWFSLRIKVRSAQAEEAATVAHSQLARLPVLVVDDNQANRMIMSAILEHFGHEVVEADTAEAALDVIRSKPVAAVMLDQTLPGMSGLEALAIIRAMDGPLARLPVIPVTGRISPADKAAFAAAGANGFVEKPVNARAIRDALDASHAPESGLHNAA